MVKKRCTPETIIRKLREAEVLQGQGQTIAQVVKQLGITEQTVDRNYNLGFPLFRHVATELKAG